jgi:hypothetical protein
MARFALDPPITEREVGSAGHYDGYHGHHEQQLQREQRV